MDDDDPGGNTDCLPAGPVEAVLIATDDNSSHTHTHQHPRAVIHNDTD